MNLIMRFTHCVTAIASMLSLSACVTKGTNPVDPYEPINRKIYTFNTKVDSIILKPAARVYVAVIPPKIRAGVNNVYNNVNMIPTVANDILQAKWNYVIKDTWRFIANTTIGIGGIFDPASTFGLPPHSNDLGLTFAQWGDKKSPYIMIPLLGPSTIRDGMGLMFDYTFFTPYPYLRSDPLIWSLLAVRYVDLRSQMLDTEKLMADAIDKYSFMRDAYLQHRNFLINGEQQDTGDLYVDDDEAEEKNKNTILPEEPANGTPSKFPLTTAQHVTHRATTT
ncbi:MAG: VacJ family lipoprotein [Legionellaceae bacterium]|nr:VacJ family lipoprotein [Legionellaceae bacterium]